MTDTAEGMSRRAQSEIELTRAALADIEAAAMIELVASSPDDAALRTELIAKIRVCRDLPDLLRTHIDNAALERAQGETE